MSQAPPPIPVQTLDYPTLVRTGRPSLVAAIGVLSILIACASVLLNVILALTSFAFVQASRASIAFSAATPAPPTTAELLPPTGMPAAERRIVINALGTIQPLSPNRKRALDDLLKQGGRNIVHLSGRALTSASIAANVAQAKQLPSPTTAPGPDVFMLGDGRLEVYDDHAAFFPAGGRDPIRASPVAPAIPPEHVQAVVRRVQQLSAAPLNQAQLAALSAELSTPGQQSITLAATPSATANQVRYAMVQNGTALIGFAGSGITLDLGGKITAWSARLPPIGIARTRTFHVNALLAGLAMADAAASIALAVYLLICGILVFRNSFKADLHHRIFAIAKIPLAIFSAVVWASLWASFLISIQTARGSTTLTPPQRTAVRMVTAAGIAIGISGAIYPLALLLARRTRTVRDYYRGAW